MELLFVVDEFNVLFSTLSDSVNLAYMCSDYEAARIQNLRTFASARALRYKSSRVD